MRRPITFLSVLILVGAQAQLAFGGMPSVMPEDLKSFFRLAESPHQRLIAISFFLFGLAFCAAFVRLLWNLLARDFKSLPRLTYPRALALVILWGLLFVIVLTMISGARELMTPGAWRKQGSTYTLEKSADEVAQQAASASSERADKHATRGLEEP